MGCGGSKSYMTTPVKPVAVEGITAEMLAARFNAPLKIVIAGHTGKWASMMGEYKIVAELFNDHPMWQMGGTEHFIYKRNINTPNFVRHNWTCSWNLKSRGEQGGCIFSNSSGGLPVSADGNIKYGWWKGDTKESIWDANITWSAADSANLEQAVRAYVAALGGRTIRLRNAHWNREYLYSSSMGHTKETRHVLVQKDPKQPETNKKDWKVELVPGATNQIRLRNAHWNHEYMYSAAMDATKETRRVLVHKDPKQPESTKKDWEVELVPGTTNKIRLRNMHWNREYLYAAAMDLTKETRLVLTHKDIQQPESTKKDWEVEFVSSPVKPRPKDGKWHLLLRQTAPFVQPAEKWKNYNSGQPDMDNYSVLDAISDADRGDDGKLHFKIVWPKRRVAGPNSQEWKQTSNPVIQKTQGCDGYEAVNAPFSTAHWQGLRKNGGKALLDGCMGDYWFYAIGSSQLHKNGIPGPGKGEESEQQTELWVHEGAPKELTLAARGKEHNQRTLEEQGFGLRRVEESEMEKFAVLLQCTTPEELGKGRDAKTYPRKYSELRLFAAWHFDVPDRTDIYDVQKRIVVREMASAGIQQQVSNKFDHASLGDVEAGVNEKWFLHGTQPQLVMPIFSKGLNERLSSLGGMFGAGVYLSEDAEKIDQYTRPDDGCNPDFAELHAQLFHPGFTHPGEDLFYVFVVRSVLGVPCYTVDGKVEQSTKTALFADEDRRELGYIPGKEPLRYHSLIAETGAKLKRYREFVVYNAARTNIRYVLAYRRV